jgi:hypothetical protein
MMRNISSEYDFTLSFMRTWRISEDNINVDLKLGVMAWTRSIFRPTTGPRGGGEWPSSADVCRRYHN